MWVILLSVFLGIVLSLPLYTSWNLVWVIVLVVFIWWKPQARLRVRNSQPIQYLASVANIKILNPEAAEFISKGGSLFSIHPHGFLSITQMALFVFGKNKTVLSKFANESISLVSSLLLAIPLLGHLARLLGCESIDKVNFIKHLERNGSNIVIAPGGTREIMYTQRSNNGRVVVIKREGFLRLAYNHKKNIVPILASGESTCHDFYWSENKVQQRVLDTWVRYPLPVIAFGKYYSFWPKSDHVINVVIGKNIDPTKYKNVEMFIENYYCDLVNIGKQYDISVELMARHTSEQE